MGTAKKFQDTYPKDKNQSLRDESDNLKDKREIEAYLKKISELLDKDPELQKKAALIISQLINSSKK